MLFSFYSEMLCLFQRCAVMESAFIFSFSEFSGKLSFHFPPRQRFSWIIRLV